MGHVILEVKSGQQVGRKIHLREGQVAQFGRTNWADYGFPEDPGMADIHFVVKCGRDGCLVRNSSDRGTKLNDAPLTSETRVKSGDTLTAGNTRFAVKIEGTGVEETLPETAAAAAAASSEQPAAVPQAASLASICQYIELDPAVQSMAHETQDPNELVRRLEDQKEFGAAIRLQAHLLPKPVAVRWACQCIREAYGNQLPAPEMTALEAAEKWAEEPSEAHRRAAESASEAADYSGPGSCAALAAFCSEGSIGPVGYDEVTPDPRLTGKGITGALLIAGYHGDPKTSPDRFRSFLKRGRELAKP